MSCIGKGIIPKSEQRCLTKEVNSGLKGEIFFFFTPLQESYFMPLTSLGKDWSNSDKSPISVPGSETTARRWA